MTVVTRTGLLDCRQVVKLVGAAEQVTLARLELATVKVFAPVLVTVKAVPFRDVAPPLNVPPTMPLMVTPVVAPAGRPCGSTVVTVQGVPVATDATWKMCVVLAATVKVLWPVTVAVFPPELMLASENFPESPNNQIVLVWPFAPMPCGWVQVIAVGVVPAELMAEMSM